MNNSDYIGIYTGLSLDSAVLYLVRFYLFIKFTIRISLNIFQGLLKVVLRAPIWFFDTNPLGRIISRFTSDIDKVDFHISISLQYAMFGVLNILSAVILISIITPWFLLFCFLLFLIFIYFLKRYLPAARDIKRILDVIRGPIISRFTEANTGLV